MVEDELLGTHRQELRRGTVVLACLLALRAPGYGYGLLKKLEAAGIPRAAYDEDVARVRRLIPGPIRRAARRIPAGIQLVADAANQSGVPQRLRRWLTDAREGELGPRRLRPMKNDQLVEGSIA